MSDGTDKIAEYYNGKLDYQKEYLTIQNPRLDRIKEALSRLVRHRNPKMNVLDIGCGIGITSKHMADAGATVTAVDIAEDLIGYAKEHLAHKHVTYIANDIKDMEFKDKFDLIVFADVFEHLPREQSFSIVWRLLKHNTHAKSMIYLNIPGEYFIKFIQEKYPEKLQIIDEAYSIEGIIEMFEYFGFVPMGMGIYGLDVECQYNEFIFVTRKILDLHYEQKLKQIYGGNN